MYFGVVFFCYLFGKVDMSLVRNICVMIVVREILGYWCWFMSFG